MPRWRNVRKNRTCSGRRPKGAQARTRRQETTHDGLMKGKRGLIMGLANDKSLAWGIAQKLHEQGAELAFSYQGEALEKRVRPLAESLGSDFLIDCDVSDMDALDRAFARWLRAGRRSISSSMPSAFPTRTSCAAGMSTPARQFPDDHEHLGLFSWSPWPSASGMMPNGGSILTLSYYGAEKVVPHYNVMGVAKAALETSVRISPTTLARTASGSTRSRPARSRPWRPAASAISATSSNGTS
jgi:enoyl-[acyl-carrier protein] reductase I